MEQRYQRPDLIRVAWAAYSSIMRDLRAGTFDPSKVEVKPSEPPEPLEEGGCRLVRL